MFQSENKGDKQQLQMLHNICKEIFQRNSHFPVAPMPNTMQPYPDIPATSANLPQTTTEDEELAMAISSSIQSAIAEDIPATSASLPQATTEDEELAMAISSSIQSAIAEGVSVVQLRPTRISTEPQLYESSAEISSVASFPSTPPMVKETIYRDSIQYPYRAEANEDGSISHPIDLTVNAPETKTSISDGATLSGLCAVCLYARVEGACIPCGHMAGCMSCLLEIKAKMWGCPVCRANIYQVIKLYAV